MASIPEPTSPFTPAFSSGSSRLPNDVLLNGAAYGSSGRSDLNMPKGLPSDYSDKVYRHQPAYKDTYGGTPVSYLADISPLKGQYFRALTSNPNISPRAASMLSNSYSDRMNDVEDRAYKLRIMDAQYDTAMLSLDSARDKAAQDRNMLTSLAPFQSTLDSIITNKDLSSDEQTKELGRLGVQNAGLFAVNPAATIAYNAANKSITDDSRTPKTTAASFISSGGSTEILDAYAEANGIKVDAYTELPFEVYSKGLEASRSASLTSKELRAEQKRAADDLESRAKDLTGIVQKAKLFAPEKARPDKFDPEKFDGEISKGGVTELINLLGTPEEVAASAKANAAANLLTAQRMSIEFQSGRRKPNAVSPTPVRKSAAASFTE
jgi:hypothetical protein